jgi:hypothetical protein
LRHLFAAASMFLCFSLPAAAAAGCQGKVLFQGKFAQLNPAWGFVSDANSTYSVENGVLLSKVIANKGIRNLYGGDVYDDVEICVNLGSLATDKSGTQQAGILFWAKDYTSYYVFEVDTTGQFRVMRYAGGRYLFPIPYQANAAVKKLGQINALHVATKGTEATLYVNDQQVGTVTGQPVDGGSQVGIYSESDTTAAVTWQFTNFIISKP